MSKHITTLESLLDEIEKLIYEADGKVQFIAGGKCPDNDKDLPHLTRENGVYLWANFSVGNNTNFTIEVKDLSLYKPEENFEA